MARKNPFKVGDLVAIFSGGVGPVTAIISPGKVRVRVQARSKRKVAKYKVARTGELLYLGKRK